MKHSLRYGVYLGVALTVSYILYYFLHPIYMFSFWSKATIWELLLIIGFTFFAIAKNKNAVFDSGASFKMALITICIGILLTSIFREVFSHTLAEELSPINLEASKADEYFGGELFNEDPLETLEDAELSEGIIEDFDLFDYLAGALATLLVFCIPFSVIISFLSRQILRFRKTKKE